MINSALFNRKQSIKNDINRLNKVHKYNSIHLIDTSPINTSPINTSPIDTSPIDTSPIDNVFDITHSVNISRDLVLQNPIQIIPKIELKNIKIPVQLPNQYFDLNIINNNISKPIHMNTMINNPLDHLKRRVHKIYHVFQPTYLYNTNVSGLGDFIRSCFFMLQFCSKNTFQLEILILHPIANFLENVKDFNHIKKVEMFTQSNIDEFNFDNNNTILISSALQDFINYLNKLPITDNSVFSYNVFCPYESIIPSFRNYMRFLLEPNYEMRSYINNTITSMEFEKGSYKLIHVRSGDKYLKNESKLFDTIYISKLIIEIQSILNINNNKQTKYLLIADNNEIKYLLCAKFAQFKTIYTDITHLGEGVTLEKEQVKNTLLDFYLISNAMSIHSFTGYIHGTGFSYWCSLIYDIPYTCKYIRS
jgi:hypothetical protein